MLLTIKQKEFLKSIFSEPDTKKYRIPNDLAIDCDLVWLSHKEDGKNLACDFKEIRKDFNKTFDHYKKSHNG